MIFDTSYTDKRIIRKINSAVGLPFGFKERWKLGGIGSRRMAIEEISPEYEKYLNADHYVSNANIELRPKGVLIHFRHKLQAYTWVMPYAHLKIEEGEKLKLTAEGKFIRFKNALEMNAKFIEKMVRLSK
ncbi:MAG: hypothetical protein AB8B73_05650 [Ekhidna sp.]